MQNQWANMLRQQIGGDGQGLRDMMNQWRGGSMQNQDGGGSPWGSGGAFGSLGGFRNRFGQGRSFFGWGRGNRGGYSGQAQPPQAPAAQAPAPQAPVPQTPPATQMPPVPAVNRVPPQGWGNPNIGMLYRGQPNPWASRNPWNNT